MSFVLTDGVVMPELPVTFPEKYRYKIIAKVEINSESTNLYFYSYMASTSEFVFAPASITGDALDRVINMEIGYATCVSNSNTTEWGNVEGDYGENTTDTPLIPVGFLSEYNATYSVVWANHDIKTITAMDADGYTVGTDTFFKSCIFRLPDGTELPALPEGCFEKYPYGMVVKVIEDGTTLYVFGAGSSAGFVVPAAIENSEYDMLRSLGESISYVHAPGQIDGWEDNGTNGMNDPLIDGVLEVAWSNYDLLKATAKNDDGSYTIGTEIARKSDVNYRIYGGWLNSMGNQARRLGNVSGALKPGEMETVFSGATLEPLTVTPTTEEQTFTPESPCIGFSVVTVEAAPDTGGGDIVEPETYPDAENTTFGNETVETPVGTGKYDYGDRADGTANVFPGIPSGNYQMLIRSTVKVGTEFYVVRDGVQYKITLSVPGVLYYHYSSYGSATRTYMWGATFFSNQYATASVKNLSTGTTRSRSSVACTDGYYGIIWPDATSEMVISGIPFYELGYFIYEAERTTAIQELGASLFNGETSSEDDEIFSLVSSSPFTTNGTFISNEDNTPITVYKYNAETDTWDAYQTATDGNFSVGTFEIIWTNSDMTDATTGEVTNEASSPAIEETETQTVTRPMEREETYTIGGATLNALGAVTQRITGVAASTPSGMVSALENYAASVT